MMNNNENDENNRIIPHRRTWAWRREEQTGMAWKSRQSAFWNMRLENAGSEKKRKYA